MNYHELDTLPTLSKWGKKKIALKHSIKDILGHILKVISRFLPRRMKYYIVCHNIWAKKFIIQYNQDFIEQVEQIAAREGGWTFKTRKMVINSTTAIEISRIYLTMWEKKKLQYSE